jgi:hypothetical protein
MTKSSMSLPACALFVAPHLCSTKTRRNKKSADNIRRHHRADCWRGKVYCVSVVGVVLLSAFVAVRTPMKEGGRKRHFRRGSRVGVPTPMNAFNKVSVGRSGGGRLRYGRFGGEAPDAGVLPVGVASREAFRWREVLRRGVLMACGHKRRRKCCNVVRQRHCNKAPRSLCCVLLLMATTRRNKKSPEHRAGNLIGRIHL